LGLFTFWITLEKGLGRQEKGNLSLSVPKKVGFWEARGGRKFVGGTFFGMWSQFLLIFNLGELGLQKGEVIEFWGFHLGGEF